MCGLLHQPEEMGFEIAPVVQSGERIDHRQLHRGLDVGAQGVGIALAADLRAHAGEHLVGVDRTGQIVVHAEIEAAQHPLAVFEIGERQDRGVPGAVERAQLAADAQAVEIGKAEADDDQFVIALGGGEQGLMGLAFDVDLIAAAQGGQNALGRIGPVLDQQDATVLAVVEGMADGARDAESSPRFRRGCAIRP